MGGEVVYIETLNDKAVVYVKVALKPGEERYITVKAVGAGKA